MFDVAHMIYLSGFLLLINKVLVMCGRYGKYKELKKRIIAAEGSLENFARGCATPIPSHP